MGWAAGSEKVALAWVVQAGLRADLKIAARRKRCQRCAGMGFPAQLTQGVPPYRLLKYPLEFVLFALSVGGQDRAPACPICLWTLCRRWGRSF